MPSCVWVRVPSLARLLEIGEYSSVSFFCACERSSGKRSGPRGFVPLCHCVTSPEGEWKRLSPFRSLARFLEIEECSPVSFLSPAGGVLENAQGLAVSVARTFFRDRGVFLGLFFVACGRSSGQSLRASRFRTPLSLRDISRGRTETSVAVSVARTFLEIEECSLVSFFCACGSCLEKRSGPRGLVLLCHCVTSPEGERKRLSPFRSLARF